jgi:hypothetical protein
MAKPQWSTPERQNHLAALAEAHMNKCREGHPACPKVTHYINPDCKMEWVAKKVMVDCVDTSGNKTGRQTPAWEKRKVPAYATTMAHLVATQGTAAVQEIVDNLDFQDNIRLVVSLEGTEMQREYQKLAEAAIESWKDEDRERRNYEWKLEQQQILDGTYGKYGTSFDPVARDAFFATRPEYYLVSIGVNAFTYQRVALIRIPSTSVYLFVDLSDAVQELSKNASRESRRKSAS